MDCDGIKSLFPLFLKLRMKGYGNDHWKLCVWPWNRADGVRPRFPFVLSR